MTEEKPATDRRIEIARVALSKEHYTERLWHSDFVKALIARIDTERTARLAAEARAKMLEEAARSMIAAFDGYTNKPIDDGYWRALYDAKLALIAALKEPANG